MRRVRGGWLLRVEEIQYLERDKDRERRGSGGRGLFDIAMVTVSHRGSNPKSASPQWRTHVKWNYVVQSTNLPCGVKEENGVLIGVPWSP